MRLTALTWLGSLLALLTLVACGQPGEELLPDLDSGPGQEPDLQVGADQRPPDARVADAHKKVCPTGVPFEQSTGKLVFKATVDGKGPYTVFYDTGAPDSGLTPKVTGLASGKKASIESVEIGGVKLGPVSAWVHDNLGGFDGILGNDLFVGKVISIDYRRGLLWVEDKLDEGALAACSHLKGTPTLLALEKGPQDHLYVPASVQGLEGYLLVDTGASVGGMSVEALASSGKNNPIVEGVELKMAFGTFWAGYTLIGDITVGGHPVTRITMYSQPDTMIPALGFSRTLGVLPYRFLRHFLVSVDFNARKLRLDPFVAETMSEVSHLYGYGLSLSVNATGPVTITRVITGSPADKAGLEVGDEILTINGVKPGTISPSQRVSLVLTKAAGTKASFVTRHDATQQSLDIVAEDLFASF